MPTCRPLSFLSSLSAPVCSVYLFRHQRALSRRAENLQLPESEEMML